MVRELLIIIKILVLYLTNSVVILLLLYEIEDLQRIQNSNRKKKGDIVLFLNKKEECIR